MRSVSLQTPMHYAISETKIVKLLLEHEATASAKDNVGITPLVRAILMRAR